MKLAALPERTCVKLVANKNFNLREVGCAELLTHSWCVSQLLEVSQ